MPTNNTASSLQAVQRGAGANMSVDISIGVCAMPNTSGTYSYIGYTDAVANQTISAADPTNPRIDVVVAYVDLSVVSSSSNNNPGALKFFDVTGTPSGTPSAPSSSTIQAAVGAGNPWTPIANVAVAANATQIVTANITDKRFPWAVRANLWGGSSNTNGHTVPNVADDTVALLAATQTFQNKTFDGTNTITGKNPYKFNVGLTSAQNSASGNVKVNLNSVAFDTGSNFDAVTNHRFTAPVSGFYQFNFAVAESGASPTGYWQAFIQKNGTTTLAFGTLATVIQFGASTGSTIVQLSSSDYVELYLAAQGIFAINAAANATFMSGFLVSAT